MFEKDEVLKELHGRLVAAGIDPLDPKVQAISEVVNAFYAERTRAALQKIYEVLKELHGRLVAAGIDPLDPKVQAISEVVNAFYAERTREVLQKMQEVLSRIET